MTRTLLLGALLGAPLAHGQIAVPRSSLRQPVGSGLAHTNHLILTGPWLQAHVGGGRAASVAGYVPSDIRAAYNLPATGGSGAIAIIDAYDLPTSLNDFNVFSKQFGLPTETSKNAMASSNKTFQVVYASGSKPTSKGDFGSEIALDIEWAHAIAPNAKIVLIEAASNKVSDLLVAVRKAAALTDVREVSMSFGAPESSVQLDEDATFTAANQVYFAAAGDMSNEIDYPASSPNVIGVGGTTLKVSDGGFQSEVAWSESGGGPSALEPRPAYQNGFVGTSLRGTPDMASVGDPNTGVAVYDSTPVPKPDGGTSVGWFVVGGTSLSTPICAAITNLRGDFAASSLAELGRQYGVYAGTERFRDITLGASGIYAAEVGYDFITGLGSLLNAFPTTAYRLASMSVVAGTRVGGVPGNAAVTDGHDFIVRSVGGAATVRGTFSAPLKTGARRTAATLTITGLTTATNVSVALYNVSTRNWDVVASPTLGGRNVTSTLTIPNYASYFDATGVLQFQIGASGASTVRLGVDGVGLGVTATY